MMKEYKEYLAEKQDEKARLEPIAAYINDNIPAKLKGLVIANVRHQLGHFVRVDINANLGEKGHGGGGAEHFNGRIALFTLDNDKNAFEYLSGNLKAVGIRPLQARKQKTPQIAAEKLVAWLKKNEKVLADFVSEHTDKDGKFKMY